MSRRERARLREKYVSPLSSLFSLDGDHACERVQRVARITGVVHARCGAPAPHAINDETGAEHFLCDDCYKEIAAFYFNA